MKSAQQKADATSTKDDNSKSIIVDGFCNKKLKITPTGDGRLLNPQGLIINNKNTTGVLAVGAVVGNVLMEVSSKGNLKITTVQHKKG